MPKSIVARRREHLGSIRDYKRLLRDSEKLAADGHIYRAAWAAYGACEAALRAAETSMAGTAKVQGRGPRAKGLISAYRMGKASRRYSFLSYLTGSEF